MKTIRMLTATSAMAMLALYVMPASAKVIDVTYSGTVNYGYDANGVFGTANADLSGKSFTARYKFDDTKGYSSTSPTQNYNYGGTAYSTQSPSLGATITIDGHSYAIAGNYFGYIYGYNYPGNFSEQYHNAQDYLYDGRTYESTYLYSYTYGYDGNLPASISAPYKGPLGQYSYGYFGKYGYDYATGVQTSNTYANLGIERFSIAGAVPEPATWLMMILGFGAVGGALRTARRRSAATGAALA